MSKFLALMQRSSVSYMLDGGFARVWLKSKQVWGPPVLLVNDIGATA
jgi:hypothetical protein